MQKALALLLSACLVLAGCGSSSPAPVPAQRLVKPIDELMESVCEQYELPMPASLDSDMLAQLMDISPEQVTDFAGYISMNGDCPDQVVAIQAAPDCAEEVAKALERRRAFLQEVYAADEVASNRVRAGQVVFRGDYLFMVIAGRPEQDPATEVAAIIKSIEDNFEK